MGIFLKVFLAKAFIALAICVYGQADGEKILQWVLEKEIIDSVFVFGKWAQSGGTETALKYLGQFKTGSGQTFKIVNSTFTWGLSGRATSRILVFNGKNQYVGNYYLRNEEHLPTRLKNRKLIFRNTAISDCDKKMVTIINLAKGLPKQFFRKCDSEYGDIYTFSND